PKSSSSLRTVKLKQTQRSNSQCGSSSRLSGVGDQLLAGRRPGPGPGSVAAAQAGDADRGFVTVEGLVDGQLRDPGGNAQFTDVAQQSVAVPAGDVVSVRLAKCGVVVLADPLEPEVHGGGGEVPFGWADRDPF